MDKNDLIGLLKELEKERIEIITKANHSLGKIDGKIELLKELLVSFEDLDQN
jgi:hypothetical protein